VKLGVLLVEEPTAEFVGLSQWLIGEVRGVSGVARLAGGEGVKGLGGDPGGEVGVDRPASVGADAVFEERESAADDGMVGASGGDEAHDDETGERGGFEKAAARGLNGGKESERGRDGSVAEEAKEGVTGRPAEMDELSDGDKGGKRVADDLEVEPTEPSAGKIGELERKAWDVAPVDEPGDGAVGEDGCGEGAVVAIELLDGADALTGGRACFAGEEGIGPRGDLL
jgi:hypothetical protein